MHTPRSEIPDVREFLDSYLNQDFEQKDVYRNSIYQHHKILDCFNMARESKEFTEFDVIVRIRPDTAPKYNIIPFLRSMAEQPGPRICMAWDLFAAGSPDVMTFYCTGLERDYGKIKGWTSFDEPPQLVLDYATMKRKRWTYAPERQLFEMIFRYIRKRGLSVNDVIISHPAPEARNAKILGTNDMKTEIVWLIIR